MKEKIINRIEKRTNDLNRLLEHKEALKKELRTAGLDVERLCARILELKELLDDLS